ncbi:hypothetical protein Tco_0367838 [Tanacetum coccineum]
MALAKIAEQTKAKERDEKRKAEYRKKLNDLKPAITLHRPKSVLGAYNHWMSRGKACVEPYNLRVDKEAFRQAENSYFAINPTDIIELLTNKNLKLGILTFFEMSLYQLQGRSQQNKIKFRRISLTRFPAQSVGSSNAIALDSPYLLVLITETSQSRQHVDTSLIHIESRKPPTAELFDVGSRRISIVTANTKEYHSDVLAVITRIMRRTL